MNVIFLDIDGVLNTTVSHMRCYEKRKITWEYDYPIDEFRLLYLKKIVDKTDSKIVLSSTCRQHFIKVENEIIPTDFISRSISDAFEKYGLYIYDITPLDANRNRGNEIQSYLDSNQQVKAFIIIDDEKTGLENFLDKLVHTKWISTDLDESRNALLEKHINEALEIFERQKAKIKSLNNYK